MDNLRLGVEFPIDNDRLRQESAESQRIITGVGDTAANVERRVQNNLQANTRGRREQLGLLEKLKIKLAQAYEQQQKATTTTGIEKANAKIQAFQKEIERLGRIGKQGFDNMGRAIPDFNRPIGLINRLAAAAELYRKAAASAMNPELINKYNKKLEETEKRLKQLSNAGKEGFDKLGNAIPVSKTEKFMDILKGVAGALGLTFSVEKVVEFGKELFNLAKKAEGIELAFTKIGNGEDLEKLRAATKGTVADLDLAAVAVRADKFKIPMDTLAMGLAFARQQAKDMGTDVDYMVNSFVDGLGRKSTMILDNLGISAASVSEEMKKTGDFSKAVGNVIKKEMEKGGIEVDMLAEKTSRATTIWENFKKTIANTFNTDRLDMDRIGDMTKAGTLNMSQYKYETRLGLIEKQLKKVKDLSAERLVIEQELAKVGPAADEAKMRQSFNNRLKDIKEQEQAQNNIYQSLRKQHHQLNEQHRIAKGILSIEELRAAAEDKRNRAKDLIIRTKYDEEYVKKLYKEAEEIDAKVAKLTGSANKKDQDAFNKSVEAFRQMQQKMDDIRSEYESKSMSKNDAEVQDVRNKFAKLAKEIAQFNKDPKNQIKADGSGLTATMNRAIDDLKYRQETEALKISLEKQKQLYQDFEEYKTNFGEEKAKERFKNEVNVNSSYLAYAQSQYVLAYAQNYLSGGRGPTLDRLVNASSDLKAAEKADSERYTSMLKEVMTYEQKRLVLIATYNKKRDELIAKNKNNELTVLDEIHKEAVGSLDDQNTQKLSAYKRLFNGVEELSDTAAKKVIKDASLMLSGLTLSGKISAELAKEIGQKLKDSQKSIEDRLPSRLQRLGNELRNISGLVGEVGFGQWLDATGGVLTSLGTIKSQINSINKEWATMSTLDKLGSGFGLFGAGMSIVNTISGLFSKSDQKRQEQVNYANEMQLKQYEAMNKALERQIALIGKLYDIDKVTAYSDAQKKAAENQNTILKQLEGRRLLTGNKEKDDFLTRYNQGERSLKNYKFGDLGYMVLLSNDIDKISQGFNFTRASVEDLQQLLQSGKLDGSTAQLVQNLIDAKNAAGDLVDALNEAVTGTNFDELRDGIIDAVVNGAIDGSESANSIFRKSLLKFLADDPVLKTKISEWYKAFAEASKDGLDSAEAEKLKKEYQDILNYTNQKKKELEASSGIDITGGENSNTVAGAYKSASQESIDLLAGQTGGFRLAQLEGNQLIKTSSQTMLQQLVELKEMQLIQKAIEANTKATADNTGFIKTEIKSLNDTIQGVYNSLRSTGRI